MSRALIQKILTEIQNEDVYEIVDNHNIVEVYLMHRSRSNYPMIKLISDGKYVVIELWTGLPEGQAIPFTISADIFKFSFKKGMVCIWTKTDNSGIAFMRFGTAVGLSLHFFK